MTDEAARRFAPLAAEYARSRAHAAGRTLAMLVERLRPGRDDVALDVATGAGPTAIALARRARTVVAHDFAPAMVRRAAAAARSEGLGNLVGIVSPAERLPFRDGAFDVVTCRTACHHFGDLPAALREMARSLRAGGRLGIVDIAAAEDAEVRDLQYRVESLRDPTHRRTHTPMEWTTMISETGLSDVGVEGGVEEGLTELPEGTNVAEWCRRAHTPEAAESEIRSLLLDASPRLRRALRVRGGGPDLTFEIHKLVVIARR